MKFSVVIVNYNVKYYLEQCSLLLQNVVKAFGRISQHQDEGDEKDV